MARRGAREDARGRHDSRRARDARDDARGARGGATCAARRMRAAATTRAANSKLYARARDGELRIIVMKL